MEMSSPRSVVEKVYSSDDIVFPFWPGWFSSASVSWSCDLQFKISSVKIKHTDTQTISNASAKDDVENLRTEWEPSRAGQVQAKHTANLEMTAAHELVSAEQCEAGKREIAGEFDGVANGIRKRNDMLQDQTQRIIGTQ